MTHAIGKMANQIYETTKKDCSVYLYGSVTLDDFREGWSDIDIIALTGHKMSDDEENTLVYLRQKMMKDNPIYRSFEGVILPLADLISETPSRAVYWGTSGQRITDDFTADPFLMKQLTTSAKLLIGNDIRAGLREPPRLRPKSRLRDRSSPLLIWLAARHLPLHMDPPHRRNHLKNPSRRMGARKPPLPGRNSPEMRPARAKSPSRGKERARAHASRRNDRPRHTDLRRRP